MNKLSLLPLFLVLLYGCTKYEATPASTNDDFIFTLADTTNVRADGVSFITLRLTNTLKVKDGLKVTFTCEQGIVLQGEVAYTNHVAETKMKLGENTEPYVIVATLKDGASVLAEKTITTSFQPFYQLPEYILETSDLTGVRNDGATSIDVNLKGKNISNPRLTVAFSTNNMGSYTHTLLPYANGQAQTNLVVDNDTGLYTITAQLKDGNNVKIELTKNFRLLAAHAQSLEVESDKTIWSASSAVQLDVSLKRNPGVVTAGQTAWFSAFQISNLGDTLRVGRFSGLLNNVSDAQGNLKKVTLNLDTPGIDATKNVTIRVRTFNDNLDTLKKDIVLFHP